jgi:hypothetical protein
MIKTVLKKSFLIDQTFYSKANNINERKLITILLNGNISIAEGSKISVACGLDIRSDERWKLRNIKIEIVILLSEVVLE